MTPESEEPLGGPADRDAHGLEEMLDAAFAHADLDDNELYAIRRWQGMDRFYVHIQRRLLDGRHEDDVHVDVVRLQIEAARDVEIHVVEVEVVAPDV